MVHSHPSPSPRPSYFSEGLFPRLPPTFDQTWYVQTKGANPVHSTISWTQLNCCDITKWCVNWSKP